jgi:hypothetical protein
MARLIYGWPPAQPGNIAFEFVSAELDGEAAILSVLAVPYAVLDLAAAQADVLEHVIVHHRKLPQVAADAKLIGDRGDQPRQAVGESRPKSVEHRRLAMSRGV